PDSPDSSSLFSQLHKNYPVGISISWYGLLVVFASIPTPDGKYCGLFLHWLCLVPASLLSFPDSFHNRLCIHVAHCRRAPRFLSTRHPENNGHVKPTIRSHFLYRDNVPAIQPFLHRGDWLAHP